jgi:uncharacterized protein (DUF2252 family)
MGSGDTTRAGEPVSGGEQLVGDGTGGDGPGDGVAERAERGRQARKWAPRAAHAAFEPAPDRADPVQLLQAQGETRVAELLPIRYGRMVSSPFAFFRGAAAIMAADLADQQTTGLQVQLCGDAHLSNFGVFASAERQLVFDLNDFDETLRGPWEFDVKRLAASVEVAARGSEFTAADRRSLAVAVGTEYRRAMADFAGRGALDVWYSYLPVERTLDQLRHQVDASTYRRTGKLLAKAKTRDHLQAFSKLVTVTDGRPRFISSPPLLVPIDELTTGADPGALQQRLADALQVYESSLSEDRRHVLCIYRLVPRARKVVGVGSVGTRCWVVLLTGRDVSDPLILQVKEAGPSVLATDRLPSTHANQGERVVAGQRLMQASSDILLGWQRAFLDGAERDFYVRQLRDWKGSVELDQLDVAAMMVYVRLCAATLARAHARSGDRVALAAYLGRGSVFDEALASFAASYADQNERDHAALARAVQSGQVTADLET